MWEKTFDGSILLKAHKVAQFAQLSCSNCEEYSRTQSVVCRLQQTMRVKNSQSRNFEFVLLVWFVPWHSAPLEG